MNIDTLLEMPTPQKFGEDIQHNFYLRRGTAEQEQRLKKEEECRIRAVLAGRPLPPPGRLRIPGGGRKSLLQKHPEMIPVLFDILQPKSTPEYVPPFQWSCLTDREILKRLREEDFRISATSISSLLGRLGMRRHPAVTTQRSRSMSKEGQFDLIAKLVPAMIHTANPVLYVDIQRQPEDLTRMDMLSYASEKEATVKAVLSVLEESVFSLNQGMLILLDGGDPLGINDTMLHAGIQHLANKSRHTIFLSYIPSGITRWKKADNYCAPSRSILDGKNVLGEVCLESIDGDFEYIRKTVGKDDFSAVFNGVKNLPLPLRNWNRVFMPNRSHKLNDEISMAESTEIKQ